MLNLFSKILIDRIWYSKNIFGLPLIPFSFIYIFLIKLRKIFYQIGLFSTNKPNTPIIVVGNITIGGTGKTPLVIWLASYYKKLGYSPGIISRGYKGKYTSATKLVTINDSPVLVGDEPLLIKRNTNCPVIVGRDRVNAAKEIIEKHNCNLVISDDGLQHYSLGRDIEIAVIDGQRRFGNGHCIPAGPLRELKDRLDSVDLVVSKYHAKKYEYKMEYIYNDLVSLNNPEKTMPISGLNSKKIHAISGISNPENFFSFLRSKNFELLIHEYPDHHIFNESDIKFNDNLPVVMTEKDAVKCFDYVNENCWYQPISVKLSESFIANLNKILGKLKDG
mgnify:CR=1 FL=1